VTAHILRGVIRLASDLGACGLHTRSMSVLSFGPLKPSSSPNANEGCLNLTMRRATTTGFDFDSSTRDEIAIFLAKAALAAGPAVMDVYEYGGEARAKPDGSPVTIADRRAEAVICKHLGQALPHLPIMAEESIAEGQPLRAAERFLLVDPLDGTREFLAHNGEFTINVALVEKGEPTAGAVYAPAIGQLWYGGGQAFVCEAQPGAILGENFPRRRIHTRLAPRSLIALASRSHSDSRTEAFLERLPIAERRSGGSSLKFCLIAQGSADVYPRFAPTMEWDTAAADAVLRAAGGIVLDLSGSPLAYGKIATELRNDGFVAWGDPAAPNRFGQR